MKVERQPSQKQQESRALLTELKAHLQQSVAAPSRNLRALSKVVCWHSTNATSGNKRVPKQYHHFKTVLGFLRISDAPCFGISTFWIKQGISVPGQTVNRKDLFQKQTKTPTQTNHKHSHKKPPVHYLWFSKTLTITLEGWILREKGSKKK